MFRYAVKVLRDSGPLRHNETHCTGADANGRERTGMLPFRTLEKTREQGAHVNPITALWTTPRRVLRP